MSGAVLLTSAFRLTGRDGGTRNALNSAQWTNSVMLNADYSQQRSVLALISDEYIQPGLNMGISYYSKWNYDISLQSGVLFNADTLYANPAYELDLDIGYTYYFSPDLQIHASYSHYAYSRNSNELHTLFSDVLQLDLYAQRKWYYGGLYSSYLFGVENTFYGTFKNGISLNLNKNPYSRSMLNLGVEMDLNVSDVNYYNPILLDYWDGAELAYWLSLNYAISMEVLLDRIAGEGLQPVKDWAEQLILSSYPDAFDPAYNLSYINIGFPISFISRRFGAYLFPTVVIPVKENIFYDQNTQFLISMGVTFSFR